MSGDSQTEISFALKHQPSGTQIVTMAPVDNGGDGSSFSPTDLCAASLGACAATVMGLYAKKNGFTFKAKFEVEKQMQAAPRRISSIELTYKIDCNCSDADFEKLKRAAHACPVRQSLHPEVQVIEHFQRVSL
jgi:uncharacterized OsmC-like protein